MAKRANFILDFSLVVWFADTKKRFGSKIGPGLGGKVLLLKIILLGIIRPESVP